MKGRHYHMAIVLAGLAHECFEESLVGAAEDDMVVADRVPEEVF